MSSKYDVGPKLGIQGEKEFRKAINDISTNIKTLGTEMLAVTSAYDANDKSTAALTDRNKVLVKQIDAQKEKLAKLQEGLTASKEKFGENAEITQRWQQCVNVATANLNQMERQLAENTQEMDSASVSAEKAGGSMEELGDKSEGAGSKLSALTVAMGNLISSGIEAAVNGLKNMVSAVYNLDEATAEYREAQGKLNTAFEAAGYSTEAAQRAYSDLYKILGDTDTAAEAAQLLAQLADSEQDMSQWTEIAAGVAGTFGDALPINSLIEAANETAKVGKVTGALADALNWVGTSEDEFNDRLAACGSESERNKMIMESLSDTYSEAADAFYRNNEAIVQARAGQAMLDGALAGLGEKISSIKNSVQAEFMPAIAQMASGLSSLLSGDQTGLDQLSQGLDGFVSGLSAALPQVLETGRQIVESLLGAVTENLPRIIEAGANALMEFVSGLVGMLPELTASAMEAVTTLAGGISSALPELIPAAADAVLQIAETLTDPDSLGKLIEAALEMIVSLADGLVKALPKLAEKVPQIVVNIVTVISNNLPKMHEAALKLISSLAAGLIKAIPTLVKSVPQLVSAIVSGFTSMASKFLDIGKNIVSGIWEGIKGMGSWIKEKVSDFFGGIVDSVKGLLGIHSPSKVFAGIGGYMAEGLGEGFQDEIGGVQRRIARSMAELAGNASASVKVSGSVSGGQAYGGMEDLLARMPALLAEAVHREFEGMGMYMNMRKVGEMTSRWQANNARAMGV